MTAWMVLTKRELFHRVARAGEFGPGLPWKPESVPCPELPDASVICVVIVNQEKRPQLVAVLHDPEYVGKGYRGDSNTTLFRDVTAQWVKLKFADAGGNNKFDPAATLKKPRPLTAADLKILGIRAAGSPAQPPLACIATIVDPSVDDLDALQIKQVATAGVGYDGQKLSAAQRLQHSDLDDGSFLGSLVFRRFQGSGGADFDVLTYMGDSGRIFRAGTTKDVARVIQGSVQCDDAALAALLERSMRAAPAKSGTKAQRPRVTTSARKAKGAPASKQATTLSAAAAKKPVKKPAAKNKATPAAPKKAAAKKTLAAKPTKNAASPAGLTSN